MTLQIKSDQPSFILESELLSQGFQHIAGVDEVGRGPLAGPVVTAAVILNPDNIPDGLNDSKKLTEKRREALYELICASSHVAVSSASATRIDEINIRAATLAAMTEAVTALAVRPQFVLIDGRDIPSSLEVPSKAVIKGDGLSVSIAAASIIAKVTRDRMMLAADRHYPGYDFYRHKGYGTAYHRNAIARLGPCPLHRRSFQPVKSMTQENTFDENKNPIQKDGV